MLTYSCIYWQSLWAACWLMEKVQLSLFYRTLGCWDLLRRRLWTSLPTLTCGGNTEITSYVKYDAAQILQDCKLLSTAGFVFLHTYSLHLVVDDVDMSFSSCRWGTLRPRSFQYRWRWKAAHSTSKWQARVQMARTRDRSYSLFHCPFLQLNLPSLVYYTVCDISCLYH